MGQKWTLRKVVRPAGLGCSGASDPQLKMLVSVGTCGHLGELWVLEEPWAPGAPAVRDPRTRISAEAEQIFITGDSIHNT